MGDTRIRLEGAQEVLEGAIAHYRLLTSAMNSDGWRRQLSTTRIALDTFISLEPKVTAAIDRASALFAREPDLEESPAELLNAVNRLRSQLMVVVEKRLKEVDGESPSASSTAGWSLDRLVAEFRRLTAPVIESEPLARMRIRGRWQRIVAWSALWLWFPVTQLMLLAGISGPDHFNTYRAAFVTTSPEVEVEEEETGEPRHWPGGGGESRGSEAGREAPARQAERLCGAGVALRRRHRPAGRTDMDGPPSIESEKAVTELRPRPRRRPAGYRPR